MRHESIRPVCNLFGYDTEIALQSVPLIMVALKVPCPRQSSQAGEKPHAMCEIDDAVNDTLVHNAVSQQCIDLTSPSPSGGPVREAGGMAAAEQGSPTGASSSSLLEDDLSELMNDLRSDLAEVEKQEEQVRPLSVRQGCAMRCKHTNI